MKVVEEKIQLYSYSSKAFDMYFGGKSFAVLDIECTGLSPLYCKVILSGIMLYPGCGDEAHMIQLFADGDDDEKEIIRKTEDILKNVDFIITYNGRHYDIPFMAKRAEKLNISFSEGKYDLDLYQVVNGHSNLRDVIPSLSQKNVERYMGLSDSRDDRISGGESVKLYEQYMSTKSFELEKKILLHNHDDLIQLYKLLPVIGFSDFHSAMFKLGFISGNFIIQHIGLKGRELHVKAKQVSHAVNYISFPTVEQPFSLMLDSVSGDAELIIPCDTASGAAYVDASAILGDELESIQKYPSVTNGYLIVSNKGKINHLEVNGFLIALMQKLTKIIYS